MSAPADFTLDQVLAVVDGLVEDGTRRWLFCCPIHDDEHPSASIAEGDAVPWVVHCFVCGKPRQQELLEAILARLDGSATEPRRDDGPKKAPRSDPAVAP